MCGGRVREGLGSDSDDELDGRSRDVLAAQDGLRDLDESVGAMEWEAFLLGDERRVRGSLGGGA